MSNPEKTSLEKNLEASLDAEKHKKKLLNLRIAAALLLVGEQQGSMVGGHLRAVMLAAPYSLTEGDYSLVLKSMVDQGLVISSTNLVTLTPKGRETRREIQTMSKTKTAPAPKDNLKEKLVESIAAFPQSFKLKDHKGTCMIAPSKSSIDPETGEESLAVVDKKGELVNEFTAAELKAAIEGAPKGGKPKGKTSKKTTNLEGKETHVDRMRRLLLAGKTDEEIYEEFRQVFMKEPRRGTHTNSTDEGAIKRRVYLYKWRAADWHDDVKKVVEARAQEKAEARESAKKAEREAKEAAKAEKAATKEAEQKKASKKAEKGSAKAKKGKASKKAAKEEASEE